MRSVKLLAGSFVLLLASCHTGQLKTVSGSLVFSSPDQPNAVIQADAGLVEIDFGQVAVGSTDSLTLAFESLAGSVTLGTETALQPDPEFNLPFSSGTVVNFTPEQITASFSPTSLGEKSAVFQLTYSAPKTEIVVFKLSGEGIVNGLVVAPNPVDFGQVELNQSQSLPLTITNNGQMPASLVLSAPRGANASLFSLGQPASMALAPGASMTTNAAFAPLTTVSASASFTVSGLTGNPPVTVDLSGTGVQSWLQVTSPLDFGFVQIGNTRTKSAVITNISKHVTRNLIAPAPALNTAIAFSLAPPALAPPIPIPPGQSVTIPVAFTPPSLDLFGATLWLTTDDPGSRLIGLQIQGYGGGPLIQCTSQVSFGPVAVGHTASEPVICLNIGTDISSQPNVGLQIAQADLSADNPDFVPNLTLPDGGTAGPGFSVFLKAGQTETVSVAFHAVDAGIDRGRLTVPSNDTSDLDAGTVLVGQGVQPGVCNYSVIPSQVAFGQVPNGASGLQQILVSNTGQDFCIFSQAALDPKSDPAFSLPQGPLTYQLLSYPGNPNNPNDLPGLLIIDVAYAPTTTENAAEGSVQISVQNGSLSEQSVSLTGTSLAACLSIEPQGHDFGLVGFSPSADRICTPDAVTFTAQEICDAPVTITAIDLNPGVEFSLLGLPQLPLTLNPGSQTTFQAAFVPTSIGEKVGSISVTTDESPPVPYRLALKGNPELSGTRTDTFVVPQKKVDLLWVLDTDDDYSLLEGIADFLPTLVASMDEAQLDYRMAVTDTDNCDAGFADRGSFEPCDHCSTPQDAGPLYVTPDTSGGTELMSEIFYGIGHEAVVGRGCYSYVYGDEGFLDALSDAFSPQLRATQNSGFPRPGAYLAVVLVNQDAVEDDTTSVATVAQVETLLNDVQSDPASLSVSLFGASDNNFFGSKKIVELVNDTGGAFLLSDPSSQDSLLNLFALTDGLGVFTLTSEPARVSGLEVAVDGNSVVDFSYDPTTNSIVFTPGEVPPVGAVVTVTYPVGCP